MDILNQIENLNLSSIEWENFKNVIINKIDNKKTKNDIDWLIHYYHIDKDFFCLTHAKKVFITNYDNHVTFTIEFPTRHDVDGWETTLSIKFVKDVVTNVVYNTDRYVRFDYSEREKYPYGDFQGDIVELKYKHEKLKLIQMDIDEIKELCTYLINLDFII